MWMENISKNGQLWRTSFYGVKYIDYDNTTGRMQKQGPGYSPTLEKKQGQNTWNNSFQDTGY